MKRFLKRLFKSTSLRVSAVIIAVTLACLPLAACAESYRGTPVEGSQDTSYVVVSNGGSAVQYGNYVYFINGYRGYDDEDGSENYWGNVVKGGLYRAELMGKDAGFEYMNGFGLTTTGLKTFVSEFDTEKEYDFVNKTEAVVTGYEKDDDNEIKYDDDGNPVEIKEDQTTAVAVRIASKTVGTSGYENGGLYIYGDYVYYASPSNKQDRDGNFETSKTMFFRTKLDGTKTTRLYTTKSETSESAYAFYNQNGKVYLTVQDGTSIISVTVGKKVEAVKEVATDVSGVLFPTRDIYFEGMDTNEPEDFIYYTREINEEDKTREGNVVGFMRPDGSESAEIISNGHTIELMGVDGGYLFYKDAPSTGEVIRYTNLFNQLMEHSPTYKAAYEAREADIKKVHGENSSLLGHQDGIALNVDDLDDFDQIYCFRPDKLSNQVYALCADSDMMQVSTDGTELTTIYTGSVDKIYAVRDTKVYFGTSGGDYYFTNAYLPEAENKVFTLGEDMNSTSPFGLDVMGDFAVMFGTYDDYADDYTMFVNCNRVESDDHAYTQFVGERTDDDKYDPSVELQEGDDTETE